MPELPEVETLKLGLQKYLVEHRIEDIELLLKKQLEGDPKAIIGATVTGIRRFGKGLVIDLDNQHSLAIHIKLTGQLIYVDPNGTEETNGSKVSKEKVGKVPNQFTHIIFHLDKGAKLFYNDIRQFGWIRIIKTDDVSKLEFFKGLGPDILNSTTVEQFNSALSKARTPIKVFLLDQSKFSGVGNIYANDSLYLSKINPKRPANSLTQEEAETLYNAIHTVMKKGLEEGGASELTFVNVLGQMGNYQNHALIYGKQGQKCKVCGSVIQKYMLGGRGTYVCPTCQK